MLFSTGNIPDPDMLIGSLISILFLVLRVFLIFQVTNECIKVGLVRVIRFFENLCLVILI